MYHHFVMHLLSLVTLLASWYSASSRICPSIDLRNNLVSLDLLRGCRVVEGYVRIVLMERAVESDFENLTLPELREISDYLMFYRVGGLRTIGRVFPNLEMIRGNRLFEDYALVVYEMFNLQELGLHSLTVVVRGAVRIEKNPCK